MEDWQNITEELRRCTHCASDLPCGTRPVFQFHPDARILIVGQAPGRRVHETGIPFSDPSGDRLRQWMGIEKDVFYDQRRMAILPMGFCYPGTAKHGDLPPLKICAELWREKLLALMPNIQLTIVIGQYAMDWHIGVAQKRNLTETVRHWQEYGAGIMPLPHPSPRNNIWLKRNPWFEEGVIPELQLRVAKALSART